MEFFNHQLFDYDFTSEEDVRKFVTTYGFPFFPRDVLSAPFFGWLGGNYERIRDAVVKTDSLAPFAALTSFVWQNDLMEWEQAADYATHEDLPLPAAPQFGRIPQEWDLQEYASYADMPWMPPVWANGCAISTTEAALCLEMLQTSVTALMERIRDGAQISNAQFEPFNACTMNPLRLATTAPGAKALGGHGVQDAYLSLTAAICNQVVDTFADDTPWRECACVGCGRIFKRKQGKANKPTSDSYYCCKRCEERQKKRNQSAAAKNRIKHR